MSLSEQERLDLAGLASEFGTPESAARALRLLETSPEAVSFFQQIVSVHHAFKQAAEESPPPLSAEKADALEAVILAKARARPPGRFVPASPWRRGGLAAMIAVAGVAALVALVTRVPGPDRQGVAEVTFLSNAVRLNANPTPAPRHASVALGEPIETGGDLAVVKLPDGGLIALYADTRLVPQGAGRPMELTRGDMYIQTAGPMRVLAGDATIHLAEEDVRMVIRVASSRLECEVFGGQVRVTRFGTETVLSRGQWAQWLEDQREGDVRDRQRELPPWVERALPEAAAPAVGAGRDPE